MVKDRLVQANTLLEAFGNARTPKNDNASRFVGFLVLFSFGFVVFPILFQLNFESVEYLYNKVSIHIFCLQGKFLDIEFDYKGDPVGGQLIHCKFASFLLKII